MTTEPLPLLGPVPEYTKFERNGEIVPSLREQYLRLDKAFGSVPAERLYELAARLQYSEAPRDLAAAGSAIIEATIFSPHRTEDTLDRDIDRVMYGSSLLQDAAAAHWRELEHNQWHYDDQTGAIRAEVRAAFAPIYRDIVCGEIVAQSRQETFTQLAYWGRYTLALDEKFGSSGLAFEIAALMGGLADEAVLLPGTPRADDGMYNDYATHDFTYITLDDEHGFITANMPLELKNESNSDRRLLNARRYSQSHVVVLDANRDLGLRWDNLPTIFSQSGFTGSARRNLHSITNGIFNRVLQAEREFGANYNASY